MHQELFRIPMLDLPISSFGLMMVIGCLSAIQLAKYLARRSGLDPEIFVNAGILALFTGVLGARLSHIIENIHQYTDPARSAWANFIDAVNIRSGGLTYYGGFLLAFPTLVIYAIKKKLPLRLGMNIVAPCIMIGLAFGRIGCFLNGCCYGAPCDLPWAVRFPYHSFAYEAEFELGQVRPPPSLLAGDERWGLLRREELKTPELRAAAAAERSNPVHPAQLYSAFTAFLIAGIVLTFFTLGRAPGRAFALMMILEGTSRFILELLRVEQPVIGRFSLSMLIGIGVAAVGLVLWIAFAPKAQNRATPT